MNPLRSATPSERYAYALETHRMALDLWDYALLPWRWFEWRRRYQEIQRRMALLREVQDER